MGKAAVFTTMYPGMKPYCAAWSDSVANQTDADFDLWIAIDQLAVDDVFEAAGRQLDARFVVPKPGATPAAIREQGIREILSFGYDAIVFVDSDDILHPTRVEAAKGFLLDYDVAGTAMDLIADDGAQLSLSFSPRIGDYAATLFRWNIFGLSNSAYRADRLQDCLPIPEACVAVDWFLATGAFVQGARMGFDPTPRMSYRQHPANTARVLPPFSAADILTGTRIVLAHQQYFLQHGPQRDPVLCAPVHLAHHKVDTFKRIVCSDTALLQHYLDLLNSKPAEPRWWNCVAHPDLEYLWNC